MYQKKTNPGGLIPLYTGGTNPRFAFRSLVGRKGRPHCLLLPCPSFCFAVGAMPSLAASTKLVGSAASKLNHASRIVSLNKHRYGHDPSRYPLKSLRYVSTHPSLWKRVFCVAVVGIMTAFICLILLLVFALKPQAFAFGGGEWWSWLLAVLVVLLEAAVLTALLVSVSQSKAQTEIFTETMRLEGCWDDARMKKQSLIKDFNIMRKNYIVRIITFPLNLIPFAGAALYSAINATFVGWDYMDRYFDAIKLKGRLQRIEVLGEERSDCAALFHRSTYDDDNLYARFGFIVAFLEATPIIGSVFFPLTNACAAALFACDIEKAGGPSVLLLELSDGGSEQDATLVDATTGTGVAASETAAATSSLPYATDASK